MDFIRFGKINKNITDKLKNNLLKEHSNILREKKDNSNYDKSKEKNYYNVNTNGRNKYQSDDEDEEDEENINNNYDENNNNIILKKKKNLNEDKDKEEKDGKKKPNQYQIKRPIICICNDLYAKVLINMRKEALIFNLKRANPDKLFNRLKEICLKESLNIDIKTLKNLCEKSNYDIRVCINTLEFLNYNKDNSQLFKSIIIGNGTGDKENMGLGILGQKDLNDGLFKIWLKLFTSSIEGFSYNDILDIYYSNSEISTINDGLFVNYLKIPNKDHDFKQRAKLLNYLSYDDTIDSYVKKTFNYEMTCYQGIPGAYTKKKYSTNDRINLDFTTALIEMKKKKKENNQILKSIKNSYEEENFTFKLSKKNISLDILPYLNQLIQPEFREINIELMNKKELIQVYYALNVMHSFGIKFSNIFSGSNSNNIHNNNQNNYNENENDDIQIFEPNIRLMLDYEFINKNFINKISKKQKFIMKNEFDKFKTLKETSKIINALKNFNYSSGDIMDIIKSSSGNGSLNLDDIDKEKGNKNIFKLGNKRTFTQMQDLSSKFIYRYNEGVTNCVRRSLNISYFFK
jgi:DNA polymerase III delta prime subunit